MGAKLSIGKAVETDEFVIAEDVLSHRKADELLFALEQVGDTVLMRKRDGIFVVHDLLKVSAVVIKFA